MKHKFIVMGVGVLGVILATAGFAKAESVNKHDGTEVRGNKVKWFAVRQEYQVEDAEGSIITIPVDDVASVRITKPVEFDKAAQACDAKQYDVAIPILEDLISRYKRLEWDGKASELLAKACFGKGDYKKAAQVMGGIIEGTPKSLVTDDQNALYWSALLNAQMMAVLKKNLNEAIAGESRSLAALALIRRGEMNKEDGKREDAVLDFLRVILVYDDILQVQPEALYKGAKLLDEMRDPRADELKKRLTSRYSDSPYARKLGG
ncbi:MAG: hypothetical protein WCO42_02850 [bacterium]